MELCCTFVLFGNIIPQQMTHIRTNKTDATTRCNYTGSSTPCQTKREARGAAFTVTSACLDLKVTRMTMQTLGSTLNLGAQKLGQIYNEF